MRRCARMGLKGGDLAFKRMSLPLYHHGWYALWEAAAECRFPISFHSTGFKDVRAPDTPEMEKEYFVAAPAGALGAVPARHHGGAGLAARLGRLREVPRLQLRAGRIGRDLASLRVRPARHRVPRPRAQPRLQDEAQRLLPPPGLRDLSAGQVPRADRAADRRGQHHLGRRLPAPGLHLAEVARDPGAQPGRASPTACSRRSCTTTRRGSTG